MIYRAPAGMHLAVDLHVDLINILTPLPETPHPAHPLAPDVSREQRTEPVPPQPHRLMAHIDAPLKKQIFDIPQAEREPHVEHHHEIPWGLGSDPF